MKGKEIVTAVELREKMLKSGAILWGDRIAVAREKRLTKIGSIILPETAQYNQAYGVVILMGTECSLKVKPGDSTFCPTYGGVVMKQKVGNEVYLVEVLHAKDVYLTWPGREDVELEQDMAPLAKQGGY